MTTEMKTGLLLKSNGSIKEIELDMTEHTNNIGELLEDKLTFLGQIVREPEKINAIIIYGKNAEIKNLEINKCKLPDPFEECKIHGDIFIICMDEDSEPQNFTLNDYNELF
jgi:hypothetical protein